MRGYVLDETDPFEKHIITIVEMNRKKRADYTNGKDIYSNFKGAANTVGLTPLDAVNLLIATKEERIKSLKLNNRGPANESVLDSYLDRAVYSVLAYGLAYEQAVSSPTRRSIDINNIDFGAPVGPRGDQNA